MDAGSTVPDVIEGEASASVERPLARVPLVLNKRNFSWLTERIAGAVEQRRRAGGGSPSHHCERCLVRLVLPRLPDLHWRRTWGLNSGWLGLGHHQFRVLDRYRPRRHPDLRHSLTCCARRWRTSINRSAEAMTIFAVMCAGIFPGIHVGRVWMAWFLAPCLIRITDLAEIPLPADVGRVRGLDLLHGLGPVLVYWV